MRLRNFLFVYPVVRSSIILMQSGRKSDSIAQNVTLVCIQVYSRMILKNANVFLLRVFVNRLEMYVGVKLFRAL